MNNSGLKYVYNYPIAEGSYTGQMVEGKAQGYGTLFPTNGHAYVGQFKNGKATGHGIITYFFGDKFVGQFKDRMKDGYGTYTYSNGNKFIGKYKNNSPPYYGPPYYGIFIIHFGHRLEGQFEDGYSNGDRTHYLNGYGTQYYRNGAIHRAGVWKSGQFLHAAPIPESVNAAIESIKRAMPAVNAACQEAKAQARVVYLKAQNARYRPHYFPLIRSENEQGQATTTLLPNVITGLIGEYAAPTWVGDCWKKDIYSDWSLEKE